MILLPALFIYLFLGTSTMWIGIIFSIAIVMNAFTNDEKASVNFLLNTLPYTRKEIVSSKYLGAIVFTFMVLLTIIIGNWMIYREILQWGQLVLTISIVLVFISIAFPFSYFFKSKYLMTASIVSFVIYMIIVNKFIIDLNDRIRESIQTILSFNSAQLYLVMIVSVGIIYITSWLFSIRIYSRKVF
ncbi:ABC-2 transporter permease [Metabacillus halosaccharovorans]|uniref:ABC-2 transporter permease n=1 Tax=Metabacillus halosaccharovorans TaxID=930124 RepID=UPI0020A791E4|nr:ABC-2 transporter permease [Metabacillus halosaccharovorans]